MAMTKKERADMEEMRNQIRLMNAFHRTALVVPDVEPPTSWGTLSKGYLYAGVYMPSPRIEPACSDSVNHGFGQNSKTMSQGRRSLYSTKKLALQALREQDRARNKEEYGNEAPRNITSPIGSKPTREGLRRCMGEAGS